MANVPERVSSRKIKMYIKSCLAVPLCRMGVSSSFCSRFRDVSIAERVRPFTQTV